MKINSSIEFSLCTIRKKESYTLVYFPIISSRPVRTTIFSTSATRGRSSIDLGFKFTSSTLAPSFFRMDGAMIYGSGTATSERCLCPVMVAISHFRVFFSLGRERERERASQVMQLLSSLKFNLWEIETMDQIGKVCQSKSISEKITPQVPQECI